MALFTERDEKLCRICFEGGQKEGLISPCACTGSGQYVHNTCLLRWLALEPERGLSCTVCLEELATGQTGTLEIISKGPKVVGNLCYFDTLWQVGVSCCQLYILLWLTYFYKMPYSVIEQTSLGMIVGNQTVFFFFGFKPWAVQHKKTYCRHLSASNETWFVLTVYMIALLSGIHTPWGGILVINVISTQALEYHHRILEDINKNIGVVFVNRP